ncbi:MAG: amidohydrolase family protein, partial [Spirochaetia bacterium]
SNVFMYNLTCKIKKILQTGINVSLGTDSTATGSLNLLEEMRFAKRIYRTMYGEDIPAALLTDMVTVNPAAALKIEKDLGTLEAGKYADILVIKAQHDDPYESLLQTELHHIALLITEGKPVLGSTDMEEFFKLQEVDYTRIRVGGQEMLVKGDPVNLLKKIRKAVGYKKVLEFMPLDL